MADVPRNRNRRANIGTNNRSRRAQFAKYVFTTTATYLGLMLGTLMALSVVGNLNLLLPDAQTKLVIAALLTLSCSFGAATFAKYSKIDFTFIGERAPIWLQLFALSVGVIKSVILIYALLTLNARLYRTIHWAILTQGKVVQKILGGRGTIYPMDKAKQAALDLGLVITAIYLTILIILTNPVQMMRTIRGYQ